MLIVYVVILIWSEVPFPSSFEQGTKMHHAHCECILTILELADADRWVIWHGRRLTAHAGMMLEGWKGREDKEAWLGKRLADFSWTFIWAIITFPYSR